MNFLDQIMFFFFLNVTECSNKISQEDENTKFRIASLLLFLCRFLGRVHISKQQRDMLPSQTAKR